MNFVLENQHNPAYATAQVQTLNDGILQSKLVDSVMITTRNTIFTIQREDILNLYLFGSKLYRTCDCQDSTSDYDFIMIIKSEKYYFDGSMLIEGDLKCKDDSIENVNVNIYHMDYFLNLLKEQYIWVIMLCYLKMPFSDRGDYVWKEEVDLVRKFYYPLRLHDNYSDNKNEMDGIGGFNLVKFKSATLTDISHHVAKSKRLWNNDGDFRKGAKNLLHAARFLGLSIDMLDLHERSNSEIIDIIEGKTKVDKLLINFSFANEEWEFILKPFSTIVKKIEEMVNESTEKLLEIVNSEIEISENKVYLDMLSRLKLLIETNFEKNLLRSKTYEILEVHYKDRISEEMHYLFHFTYINSNLYSENNDSSDKLVVRKNVSSSKSIRGNRSKKKVHIHSNYDKYSQVETPTRDFSQVLKYIEKKGIEALKRDFSFSLHHYKNGSTELVFCVADKQHSPIWVQYTTTEEYLIAKNDPTQVSKAMNNEINVCQYFESIVLKKLENDQYEIVALNHRPMFNLFIDDGLDNDLIVGSTDLDFSKGTLIMEKLNGIAIIVFSYMNEGTGKMDWMVFSPDVQKKQRFTKDLNWNLGVYKRIDSLFSETSQSIGGIGDEEEMEQKFITDLFWKTLEKQNGKLDCKENQCYVFELCIVSHNQTRSEQEKLLKSLKFQPVQYDQTKLFLHGSYSFMNSGNNVKSENIFAISKDINIPTPNVLNEKFNELFGNRQETFVLDVRELEDNLRTMLRRHLHPLQCEGLVVTDQYNTSFKLFQMISPQILSLTEIVNINFHTNNANSNKRFCFDLLRINENWGKELSEFFKYDKQNISAQHTICVDGIKLFNESLEYFGTLCEESIELFMECKQVENSGLTKNLLKKSFVDNIDKRFSKLKFYLVFIWDYCQDNYERERLLEGIKEFWSYSIPKRVSLIAQLMSKHGKSHTQSI